VRIAIFTELFAPSIGGQEKFFQGLGRALVRRGHSVEVHCIAHADGLARREIIEGIEVCRYPGSPRYQKPLLASMKRDWSIMLRYALHVRAVAARGGHDFYILNQWPLLHAVLLPQAARQRALIHWCEVRHSRFFRAVQGRLPATVALNAAISQAVADEIGVGVGKPLLVLPSGLDPSDGWYREPAERSGIIALGRVVPHKNLGLLVAAFEQLKAAGYAGRLRIAGEGPDLPNIAASIARSPVRSQIDLLGHISEAAKFELLASSEILAMPSRREGSPHVVSEAMACGTPIVAADFPENGTCQVVRATHAGAVGRPTPEGFAQALQDVLDNWQAYSPQALSAAARLDWSRIAEQLEDAIACTRSAGPPAAEPQAAATPNAARELDRIRPRATTSDAGEVLL
jgi:glycosyltransferase involved in cell wall biosynthesis